MRHMKTRRLRLMKTPEGRQKYADAVVRGIAGFLGTQPPRTS
jgi:N-acetylmuramoyl-L-alanine amidase